MRLLGLMPATLFLAWGLTLAIRGGQGTGMVIAALGVLLAGVAVFSAPAALRCRASDVLIDEKGLAVDGGSQHGLTLTWAELRQAKLYLEGTVASGSCELLLKRPEAPALSLAATSDQLEEQSLRNLVDALTSQGKQGGDASPPKMPHDAPHCEHCGAPVSPSAEAETTCGYCGTTAATRAPVRERMQGHAAHAQAASANESLIGELLDQPSARVANLRLVLSLSVAGLALLSFVAAEVFLLLLGVADVFSLGASAVLSLSLAGVVTVMLTRRLIDRYALQSLIAVFGARAPGRQGEPWACRVCGGPLPAGDEHILRCVFCDCENLVGSDLWRSTRELEGEAQRLDAVLDERGRRTKNAIMTFWCLAPVAALSGLVALFFIALGAEFVYEDGNCQRGEARACQSLAFTYSSEENLNRDLPRAAKMAERGCLKGLEVDDCCLASIAKRDKWGPFDDPTTPAAAPARESMETRALVFFDD